MSVLNQWLLPKKLTIAAWVMIVTLVLAILIQYTTGFETIRYVRTVVYYLVLDYVWATIKRQFRLS